MKYRACFHKLQTLHISFGVQWCWSPNSTVTIVKDINIIPLHSRAGSTLTLTAESRTPPGIECSPVGKADSCILCQRVTRCRLETSMKTQVTDATLVKAGGVHFAMTVSEWSINFQDLPAGLWVGKAGQTLSWTFLITPSQTAFHIPRIHSSKLFWTEMLMSTCSWKIISSTRADVTSNSIIFIQTNADNTFYTEIRFKKSVLWAWCDDRMHLLTPLTCRRRHNYILNHYLAWRKRG